MLDSLLLALKTQLDNQMVSGGLMLGFIAAIAAALRKVPLMLWNQVKRTLIVTAVIDSRNDLFNAAITWLDRAPAGKTSRFFTVIQSNNDEKDGVSMAAKNAALGDSSNTPRQLPKLLYSPAPACTFFGIRVL
jgi:mitochondrial chaperone BCS1